MTSVHYYVLTTQVSSPSLTVNLTPFTLSVLPHATYPSDNHHSIVWI